MLVSLLPQLVHVRGEARLATLVGMVGDETRGERPARELVLARLLEVLLIEALRSTAPTATSKGLLCGLADPRLAAAIRRMHEDPATPGPWPSWRARRRCRVPPSSTGSDARWEPRPWTIC